MSTSKSPLSGTVTRKRSTSELPTGWPRSAPMKPANSSGARSSPSRTSTAPLSRPLGSALLKDSESAYEPVSPATPPASVALYDVLGAPLTPTKYTPGSRFCVSREYPVSPPLSSFASSAPFASNNRRYESKSSRSSRSGESVSVTLPREATVILYMSTSRPPMAVEPPSWPILPVVESVSLPSSTGLIVAAPERRPLGSATLSPPPGGGGGGGTLPNCSRTRCTAR